MGICHNGLPLSLRHSTSPSVSTDVCVHGDRPWPITMYTNICRNEISLRGPALDHVYAAVDGNRLASDVISFGHKVAYTGGNFFGCSKASRRNAIDETLANVL